MPHKNSKAKATAIARLKVEMAKPRTAASASDSKPKRHVEAINSPPAGIDEVPHSAGEIISAFTGVYERIARRLNVSPSMVSRVASGSRKSVDVEAALFAELKDLKKKLAHYE